MKKILYPLFAALVLGFAFSACSDDDDEAMTFDTTPEISAAGTYTGTFTRVQDGTTDTLVAQGSVTLAPTDSAYCADVTFACADFDLDAASVTNITHANEGYVFSNTSSDNGLGAPFKGRIDGGNVLNSSFDFTQREGRKQYVYHYTFVGTKQ